MAERLEPEKIVCQGGYDARLDVVASNPGGATYMQNFEPGLFGGYRRINGVAKYIATTVTGTGPVLGVAIFRNSDILAVREVAGDSIVYRWTGAAWLQINSDTRTVTTDRYRFWRYAWSTKRILCTDGTNPAATWDGTTWTALNGLGSPADPKYGTEFLNRIILAGYSSNVGAITITAPNDETDFDAANGAIELVVGDTVTNIRSFRDKVIIFCQTSIYQLVGTGVIASDGTVDFNIEPISRNIGCIAPDSVQEANGDLMYLATDGVRTVAATGRIGDFELGNLSKKIQPVLGNVTNQHVVSVVTPAKSQYRLFYNDETSSEDSCLGVLGGLRLLNSQMQNTFYGAVTNDQIQWEWSVLKGIKPYCADWEHVSMVDTVLHGGWDGYIYQQEIGQTINGTAIEAIFKTPDHDLKDPGKRKFIQRVTPYIRREGNADIILSVYYNYNSNQVLQPAAYTLTGTGDAAVFGEAIFDTSTFGTRPDVIQRQPVEGSGFTVAFQFYSNSVDDVSYSIQAYMMEAQMAGRR